MGLSSGTRFGFRHTVRFWAFCLDVGESIANVGMCDRFRETREKSGSTV